MHCQKLKTYMETGRVVFLPANAIEPNPAQPRQVFSQESLAQLAESIRVHGILQPLSVRRVGNRYELVAGERRLRAARMVGLGEIPCIVMCMDRQESSLAALVENLQRQDLDYIEQAQGISLLLQQYSMSQEQVARRLGLSQSAVANKLRLLRHTPAVLTALRQHALTERHARALLKLTEEPTCLHAISHIARQNLSVAQTEQYIQQLLTQRSQKQPALQLSSFLGRLDRSLTQMRKCGISAVTERTETDTQLRLTITIQKDSDAIRRDRI